MAPAVQDSSSPKSSVDKRADQQKTGLIFSKAEVEDILHEGPLAPEHEGAFSIKEAYMDMSSSDDEAEIKSPSTQLVPVQKSPPDLKK